MNNFGFFQTVPWPRKNPFLSCLWVIISYAKCSNLECVIGLIFSDIRVPQKKMLSKSFKTTQDFSQFINTHFALIPNAEIWLYLCPQYGLLNLKPNQMALIIFQEAWQSYVKVLNKFEKCGNPKSMTLKMKCSLNSLPDVRSIIAHFAVAMLIVL